MVLYAQKSFLQVRSKVFPKKSFKNIQTLIDPCGCEWSCKVFPQCTFEEDRADCDKRSINGLKCVFSEIDKLSCKSSCSCSSTSSGTCNLEGPKLDCTSRAPGCVFTVISEAECKASCSCPAVCNFDLPKANCVAQGCKFSVVSDVTGKCASSCECDSSSNTQSCPTATIAKYQTECEAKKDCAFSVDLLNCQTQCTCQSSTGAVVSVPATCDSIRYRNRCLSTPNATCEFSILSETSCHLACQCKTSRGSTATASCNPATYKERCLATPGATCKFSRGSLKTCDLQCDCIQN